MDRDNGISGCQMLHSICGKKKERVLGPNSEANGADMPVQMTEGKLL